MKRSSILSLLSREIASLVSSVSRSVATVVSAPMTPELVFNPAASRGVGTGFAVEPRLFVTALHVVEKAREVTLLSVDGTAYSARVVARDPYSDVALLSLDEQGFRPLALGPTPPVGSLVLVVGTYLGRPWLSAYLGIVAGLHRHAEVGGRVIEDLVQVDAVVATGTSGGPVVDPEGRAVAMVIAMSVGGSFALPAESIGRAIRFYRRFGRVLRPFIGVHAAELTHGYAKLFGIPFWGRGVVVLKVLEGSPAAKAGIRPGDVIVEADGVEVKGLGVLRAAVERCAEEGRVLELVLWRRGRELRVDVDVLLEELR